MVQSQSDSPRISFVTSNKNKRLLVMNGYIYQLNKSTAKVTYWICEEKMCWAGVHLDVNDQFLKYAASSHTHLPIPEREEIRLMMSKVKERVTNETTAIGQIYNEELAHTSVSRSTLANAPSARVASMYRLCVSHHTVGYSFLDSGLNRVRRRSTPNLPSSMNFDIPIVYQQTLDSERSLLADRVQRVDGSVAQRMILFSTDEQLRLLFDCSHVLMDGTFDSCPPNFNQIYSIHGIRNGDSRLLF